jgi:CDP-diacylglycerol pyrophosphatase
VRAALLLAVAAGGVAVRSEAAGSAVARHDPSALWQIVSDCVDRETARYCGCPAFARSCCGDGATADGAVVWARTERFVAIRDMVMCGCPPDFVAGLALPRARVTGIEDPRRPDGIWPFAWEVARSRIPEELEIGLAINPADARTQDQMHVHMLRLTPGARSLVDGAAAGAPRGTLVIGLPTLDAVFTAIAARVGAAEMGRHGALVARRRQGGWVALVTDRTSPQAFTRNRCTAEPSGEGS